MSRLAAAVRGRYAIERELGHGGMAIVLLAQDLKHHRPVAIKVLRPELAAALGPERFLREIEIAAQLTHPHILPLHDSGEAAGFLYYVMPYVEGESLRDRLRREHQLPLEDALQIAREVGQALDYAHRQGIVHRDIKPENILLEDGHAVVTDFGIARAISAAGGDTLTHTGIAVGTPAYMSPEQASGDRQIDGRSDIYSLACVLYEMLGGDPPHAASTPQELLARRLTEPPRSVARLRPGIPRRLDRAIRRALAPSRADRPQTATEFSAELEAAALVRASRRRTVRLALGTGVVTAALVGGLSLMFVPPTQRALFTTLLTREAANLTARRIVVAPFANETGDSTLAMLGEMAADWITQGLMRVGVGEVVDAHTAALTSKVVERTPVLLRATNRARALAEETGAGIVIWGRYYRDSDSVRFQTQITDVGTGRVLRIVDPVSGSVGTPTALVERLRERTLAALALAVDPTYGKWSGSFATPPSFEAFQETARGFESFYRGDSGDSFRRLAHAAALDSTYMTPVLTMAYFASYYDQWARAESLTRRAAQRAGALPSSERALLEIMQASLEGDLSARLRASWRLVRLAAGSPEVPTLAAATAVYLNRPREALAALSHADPKRGLLLVNPTYWRWLTAAYHELGEFEAELQAARRARKMFPEDESVVEFEIRALAALGRADEIRTQLDRLPLSGREKALVAGDFAAIAMRESQAHGHGEAGRELLPIVAAANEALARDTAFDAQAARGVWLYEMRRWADARGTFVELATRDTAQVSARGFLGLIAARQGDRREAERVAADLARIRRLYLFGAPSYWRARIAAVLGDREAAMALLRQALSQGFRGWFGGYSLHEEPDFDSLRDYPPFQELLRPNVAQEQQPPP